MKHKSYLFVLLLVPVVLVLALASTAVSGQKGSPQGATGTQSLSVTFTAQQDTFVYEGDPGTPHGSASNVYVGRNDPSYDIYTLVQFDLSALPGDAVVISATLELYTPWNLAQATNSLQQTYNVWTRAILDSWDETTVTWSNMPGAETKGDPPSAITTAPGWHSWDVTNIVEMWASSPATNHGILLRGDGTTVDQREFDALPNSNAARLTVYYEPCEAVTGVSITGPLTATTGVSITLTSVVSPANATQPITYTWTPVPAAGQGTTQARYLWPRAGQYTTTVTAANCGGTFTATHVVGVNAVRLLDIPPDIHRRAAQHLEEVRGTDAAPGWDTAQLGSPVRPLYRPDIEGVAYYEFPVVVPPGNQLAGQDLASTADQAAGYIIVSTGEHDYPIAHWASSGNPLTQELEQRAAEIGEKAVKFYKLDTLAYAAENERGERVATIGTQPFKITGLDPAWLDDPPDATQAEWTPTLALTDDIGAGQITGTFVITGPTPPPSLQFSAWASWDEMKTGYSDSYGVLAEVTRRNASEVWTAESAIRQYGQPLFKGQTYTLPLLWQTPTLSLAGEGTGYVQTEVLTRSGLPPEFEIAVLDSSLGEAIPLTATINYQNGVTETIGFVIVEPYQLFLPFVARDADPMMPLGSSERPLGAQDAIRIQAGPWHNYYAGTAADQCWYRQIPKGESPNTSDCASGCGATAWAMLFCWVDNQAVPESGNDYWKGRWGLYRLSSSYADAVAPKTWGGPGPKDMTWEIRNDIDTWCWGDDGPTTPWDMDGVRDYVSGRSATRVSVKYSNVGIGWDYIMEYARDGIAYAGPGKATPVIVGTGWLSHYPLAYGYRWRSHTYCVIPDWRWGCVTTTERQFLVNQGWEQGHGEWVASDIWYAGRVFPRSAWNDDVGLYHPSARKWYFDYDHNGATDERLKHFGYDDALPIAGDFCRDNILGDIAFFSPSRESWTFSCGHDGSINEWIEWGASDGRPVALDVDSDGFVDDIGLFRASPRKWLLSRDYVGYTTHFVGPWGEAGDLPIAGDFDRDGYADDLGRFRPSTRMWYYDYNHNGSTNATSGPWGRSGDLPVAGDFDKDGKMDDVALFQPSTGTWYYDHNHNGTTDATSGPWGWSGLLPIAGNFDTR